MQNRHPPAPPKSPRGASRRFGRVKTPPARLEVPEASPAQPPMIQFALHCGITDRGKPQPVGAKIQPEDTRPEEPT